MKFIDRNAVLSIPCPQCERVHKKTIGWIEENKQFNCENSDCQLLIKADKFVEGIARAEKSVDDFKKKFR